MKKLILILLLVPVLAGGDGLYISNPFYVAAILRQPSGGTGISDNFNRSDEDPLSQAGNWTEINDCRVVSSVAKSPQDFSGNPRGAAYSGVSCGSISQYAKWTMTAGNSGGNILNGVIFRWTANASPCYLVLANDVSNLIEWYYYSDLGAPPSSTAIINTGGAALSFSLPATFGATITGTGNSTVVKVWLNPTANAPTDASTWDGVGSAVTITDDPATAVNTGNYVGIVGTGSLGDLFWDDFYGGGL